MFQLLLSLSLGPHPPGRHVALSGPLCPPANSPSACYLFERSLNAAGHVFQENKNTCTKHQGYYMYFVQDPLLHLQGVSEPQKDRLGHFDADGTIPFMLVKLDNCQSCLSLYFGQHPGTICGQTEGVAR